MAAKVLPIEASAQGIAGEVRVGYQVAAQLGRWTLRMRPQMPRVSDLSATVAAQSEYWLGQRPHVVRVFVGTDRTWEWHGVVVSVEGGRATAELPGSPTVIREASVQEQTV